MNYPNTNIIQDNGYDLVKFKGNTFLNQYQEELKLIKNIIKKIGNMLIVFVDVFYI